MYQTNTVTPGYGQQYPSPQYGPNKQQYYNPQITPYSQGQNLQYPNPQNQHGYAQYPAQQPHPQYPAQQQYIYMSNTLPYEQPNSGPVANFMFTDKSIRNAFVRKVYGILSVQMLVTIGIMCLFIFVVSVKEFVRKHWYLYIVALIIVLVMMIVLGCFTAPRRKFPLNYILLGVFTLAEGFLVGVISANRDTMYVLYAGLITMAIVVGITIFALQTSIDFTYFTGAMLIISIVFLCFGIIAMIMRSKILNLIYCCIGVLIFSMFLLIDTQLMLGGEHQYSISPEDYVFAALNLYVDIVQIFLMVLGIFSNSD